jgi:hypothetical protein
MLLPILLLSLCCSLLLFSYPSSVQPYYTLMSPITFILNTDTTLIPRPSLFLVNLVWANAMLYNQDGSDMYKVRTIPDVTHVMLPSLSTSHSCPYKDV